MHEIVHTILRRKVELPTRRIAGRRMGRHVGGIQETPSFRVHRRISPGRQRLGNSVCCTRRERPRRRAAEQRDEHAALHSITSWARASSCGGTSRLSAFAVCFPKIISERNGGAAQTRWGWLQ